MRRVPKSKDQGTAAAVRFVWASGSGSAADADVPRARRWVRALWLYGAAAVGVAVVVLAAFALTGPAPAAKATAAGVPGASAPGVFASAGTDSAAYGSAASRVTASAGVGTDTTTVAGASGKPVSSPHAGGSQPSHPASLSSPGAVSSAAKATYTAVAGLGCSGSPTATYSDTEGYYTDGNAGWLRPSDGYTGTGCTGVYDAVPMSGTAGLANYDKTAFALYNWNFSGSFTHATCKLSVYVPDDTNHMHVGGNPTYYYFWAQNYSYGQSMTPSGDFSVSEISDLGAWVTQSPFTVTTGYVTLKLVNSGVDYDSSGNADYAHHAAAAVKLSCTQA